MGRKRVMAMCNGTPAIRTHKTDVLYNGDRAWVHGVGHIDNTTAAKELTKPPENEENLDRKDTYTSDGGTQDDNTTAAIEGVRFVYKPRKPQETYLLYLQWWVDERGGRDRGGRGQAVKTKRTRKRTRKTRRSHSAQCD